MSLRNPLEPGTVFGRLTVVREAEPRFRPDGRKIYQVLAKCECGRFVVIYENKLRYGWTRSCGCLKIENFRKTTHKITHGMARHGRGGRSPTYTSWTSMKRRCNSPKDPGFHNYGGAGIRVCERWNSFENFLSDMGERPPGTTLDRIDPTKNYEPSNCRWLDAISQQRNRKNNIVVSIDGITVCLAEAARQLEVSATCITKRAKRRRLSMQEMINLYIEERNSRKYRDAATASPMSFQQKKAELKIECAATNPPRPIGIGVFLNGNIIASITIAEFEKTIARLSELEKACRGQTQP